MRLHLFILAAFVLSIAAPAFAAGPFADVPNGHWAYKAIEKAVEAGILQGYDGKFHGNKTLNRYQMAVVVARMLDRIETMGPGGKMGKKDVENLEALVIEFADELALLNVKVSTLEDAFADLKKDVDGLKKDYAQGGAKAGISGLFQGRYVMTDDDPNATQGRPLAFTAGAATPFAGTIGGVVGAAATGVAATLPLARHTAGVPTGPAATTGGDSRSFFNIAQTSVAFDRHYDDDFYFHMQLDFDADQEGTYTSGNNVQINEAFVDLERWLFDGDVRVRAGTWALPFQRERNPEMVEYPNQLRFGFRSMDLTISPAFWDANWESVRVLGAGLWNGKDNSFQWNVAATSSTAPGFRSDGTLAAWRSANAAGVGMARGGFAPTFGGVNGAAFAPAAGLADVTGNGFGDQLGTIDANSNGTGLGSQNEMGFYGWIGDKYEGGFRWDAGYFDNGGNLVNGASGNIGTASQWTGYQANLGWWGWEDWGFMGSYYAADSDSATVAPVGAAAAGAVGGAANFVGLGLASPITAAQHALGARYGTVESRAVSALVNYKFNDDNNVTARYEDIEDTLGASEISATIWTFAWNHRISSNSLLQLEYSTPESESVTVNAAGTATRNSVDVNDDLVQLNYKVRF